MRGLPKLETRAGVHIHRVPCLRRHRHHSDIFELLTQIPSSYARARALIRNGAYDVIERKGVQHLVETAADLDVGWEICVAGDGPYLPAVRELARQKGGRVRFTGFLPREELQKLYLSSKIFVFPSLRENMPMVLLEAMSAGCAVITTNVPGCAEAAGDAAVLVEPADPDALREALRTLMADETEIERLGLLGIERAASFERRSSPPATWSCSLPAPDVPARARHSALHNG